MDLVAYAQIDELEELAKRNNIEVPRLRGYRLMKDETPVSEEKIKTMFKNAEVEACKDLCESFPFWCNNPLWYEYSPKTKRIYDRYLVKNRNQDDSDYREYVDIRWDRIHGKKKKILRFEIKKKTRRIREQFDMFNKYAGKKNVLYIHARIGGSNWDCYGGDELAKQPWFLDKVDDCFDGTYCDIYAKIE